MRLIFLVLSKRVIFPNFRVEFTQKKFYEIGSRPKARFKPTSPNKSGMDGGANQLPTYLGQLFQPSLPMVINSNFTLFSFYK